MRWLTNFLFLYDYGKRNKKLQSECVTSSLMTNYFLHFCGSWHESSMINLKNNYLFNRNKNLIKNFINIKKLFQKLKPRALSNHKLVIIVKILMNFQNVHYLNTFFVKNTRLK